MCWKCNNWATNFLQETSELCLGNFPLDGFGLLLTPTTQHPVFSAALGSSVLSHLGHQRLLSMQMSFFIVHWAPRRISR